MKAAWQGSKGLQATCLTPCWLCIAATGCIRHALICITASACRCTKIVLEPPMHHKSQSHCHCIVMHKLRPSGKLLDQQYCASAWSACCAFYNPFTGRKAYRDCNKQTKCQLLCVDISQNKRDAQVAIKQPKPEAESKHNQQGV